MAQHIFRTTLSMEIWDGVERQLGLVIAYNFIPGHKQTWDEPGQGDGAEILSVRLLDGSQELDAPRWLLAMIEDDESLRESLALDGRENEESARDGARQARYDDMRGGL